MATHLKLTPERPWVELGVEEADWDSAETSLLTTMFSQIVLIRTFEEYVLELAGKGLVHGPAHSSIGQEGGAVGSILPLKAADYINGSHRGHHQFLAKSLNYVSPSGLDLREPLSEDVETVLVRTLGEICGLARGYCRGRGGSMHLQWREAGAMGTNAIVGGGVPQALGFAHAMKAAGTDNVSVTCFGDGAANIGSVLESFNLAAAWQLPTVFFAENNQYAVSTKVHEVTAETRLSARGPGFGIASWRTDGMDPLAVYLTACEALEYTRSGEGPVLLEIDTYRFFHQNGPFPGSAFGYRTKEEEAEWRTRDPLTQTAQHLVRREIMSQGEVDSIISDAQARMRRIGDLLLEPVPDGKPGAQRIKADEWPRTDFVDVGVRGDLSELEGLRYEEQSEFTGELVPRKFIEVVAGVMERRMDTDERIVVMGEDVQHLNGGTNGATRGLTRNHADRVLGTPIAENAFAGFGLGLALDGRFVPVVEFMYPDFLWVAADQVFNQIGKARHMFGGEASVPLVLRTKVAMGTGYGSQHSMDPAGVFATAPGWRIVAPTTPYDYVGLMNTALACSDPVLVIEHVDLYNSTGVGPASDYDYYLPVGKAAVRRAGSDVTLISYLSMVAECVKACEQLGIDGEVIDLRWLDRASLDWDCLGESIRKTNRVLIVEQGAQGTSYGGWLADEIQRRYFDWLDAPIARVTGTEASPSISKVLEAAACASIEEIIEALDDLVTGN